jgi:hypothetical protein
MQLQRRSIADPLRVRSGLLDGVLQGREPLSGELIIYCNAMSNNRRG